MFVIVSPADTADTSSGFSGGLSVRLSLRPAPLAAFVAAIF